ncbi:hypothetical protein Tco_1403298 [Tanacetum coccineum]
MLNQLIATRVAEALATAAVTHAASTQEETNLGSNSSQNKACNYKEFCAVMHERFLGTEGAVGLTRWFEKLEYQFGISNVAEGDIVKFASSTLLDGLPLNIKGNVTSSKPVDLHEVIEMAQGLMYQVVQELGENSGDKRKWNGNHYNNNNPNTTSNLNPNKRPEIARVFTAGQGSYGIRPKNAELYPVLQAKEDPEAKEDRKVMFLALDVAKKYTSRTSFRTMEVKAMEIKFEATNKILRTIRGRIKETLREITQALGSCQEHKLIKEVNQDGMQVKGLMQDNDSRKEFKSKDKGLKIRSQSMDGTKRHYKTRHRTITR